MLRSDGPQMNVCSIVTGKLVGWQLLLIGKKNTKPQLVLAYGPFVVLFFSSGLWKQAEIHNRHHMCSQWLSFPNNLFFVTLLPFTVNVCLFAPHLPKGYKRPCQVYGILNRYLFKTGDGVFD